MDLANRRPPLYRWWGMSAPLIARDGSRDFDFLFGDWKVHNWRLERPLSGSSESYEFEGTCTARALWGGKANIDEFAFASPKGAFEGGTLRIYDRASGLWSLYWATPERGLITTPNVGAFNDNGVGEFFSDEVYDGKPIVCRYTWTQKGDGRCSWAQAFSIDNRATWETNWTMEFSRSSY